MPRASWSHVLHIASNSAITAGDSPLPRHVGHAVTPPRLPGAGWLAATVWPAIDESFRPCPRLVEHAPRAAFALE
jgi:hypothetical protein